MSLLVYRITEISYLQVANKCTEQGKSLMIRSNGFSMPLFNGMKLLLVTMTDDGVTDSRDGRVDSESRCRLLGVSPIVRNMSGGDNFGDKMRNISSDTDNIREVRLVFANFENAPKLLLNISTRLTVKDLKLQLLANWPKDEVPYCEDLTRIRLICMGSGILQDEHGIGAYVVALPYPTPINVSIRPAGIEPSKNIKTASALPQPAAARSRRDCVDPASSPPASCCALS